jgi:hypothetical protein
LTDDTYTAKISQHLPEKSQPMPGSYPGPRFYASSALQILEEAYEESQGTHAGTRILKAIDAISRLHEQIREASRQVSYESDTFEFNDSNSAM